MKRALLTRAAQASLSFAIRCYRAVIGPWLAGRCRFAPSCSQYALDAIASHGPWTGLVLSAARLARCHPWHPGGYDPVPPVATDCASCALSILPHRH